MCTTSGLDVGAESHTKASTMMPTSLSTRSSIMPSSVGMSMQSLWSLVSKASPYYRSGMTSASVEITLCGKNVRLLGNHAV